MKFYDRPYCHRRFSGHRLPSGRCAFALCECFSCLHQNGANYSTRLARTGMCLMNFTLAKIDAAVDQLDWAITLLLDHRAYLASITLAGASEEILGKCVPGASAHTQLKESLSEKFNLSQREVSDNHLNRARNWLKHSAVGDPFETATFELEAEATQIISRAISNLMSIDRSLPSQGQRFLNWIRKERGDQP